MALAQSREADIREYAAFALANLASNAEFCNKIGQEGGILPLIVLAYSKDLNAQCLAIAALRRMCQLTVQNRGRIIRGGGLDPLAMAGRSTEVEVQREVAATLCNLSLSPEHKVEIANSGALEPLITL